jgi:hypothetical protein
VEYINDGKRYRDLGILKDDEDWDGSTIERYSDFWFEKPMVLEWYEANFNLGSKAISLCAMEFL